MALEGCKRLITLRLILLTAAGDEHVLFASRKKPSDKNDVVVFFGGDIQVTSFFHTKNPRLIRFAAYLHYAFFFHKEKLFSGRCYAFV